MPISCPAPEHAPEAPSCGLTQSSAEEHAEAHAVEHSFGLVGTSAAMKRLRLQIRRIGPYFRIVLIRGEAGTEKEQAARALHRLSQGASGPFVRCHAAMLEEAGREGAEEGALSFSLLAAAAHGGTLFVDGADEMSPEIQAALLRMLRRHDLPAGGKKTPRLELRVIAATESDLRVQASAGRLRQELYQRLATVEIALPPVRERMEDIPSITAGLLDRLTPPPGCERPDLSPEAMARMLSYRWPGNVRELENVLRNAMLQSESGRIGLEHLPLLAEAAEAVRPHRELREDVKLQAIVERHVLGVLKDCGGNKLRAAERLGISRSTLYRMLDAGAMMHPSR
jgi:DNA-binding NtrC family response regulator